MQKRSLKTVMFVFWEKVMSVLYKRTLLVKSYFYFSQTEGQGVVFKDEQKQKNNTHAQIIEYFSKF